MRIDNDIKNFWDLNILKNLILIKNLQISLIQFLKDFRLKIDFLFSQLTTLIITEHFIAI